MPPDVTQAQAAPAAPPPATAVMADAMRAVMEAKGLAPAPSETPPASAPATDATDTTATTDTSGEPAPDPGEPQGEVDGPKEPKITQPKDPNELYERIARKDKLYQEERNRARTLEQQLADLKKEQDSFAQRFAADPIAVMRERNIRFGDVAMQALAKGDTAPKDPKAAAPASPEVEQLKTELAETREFIAQLKQEREQATQRVAHENQVSLVRDHLKTKDFPLVNELDKHGDVLALVHAHVGKNGAFADDREAAEVLEFYAREVETAEKQRLLQSISKPGVKALLMRELGGNPAQSEATSARQVPTGNPAARTTAPALSNDLASQRSTVAEPQALSIDELRQRTADEMSQIAKRAAQHR